MDNKNILISGAGVAGLTLAYWLKQYGFNPTIIEKHSVLRTGGYKIDLRGVALDILKRMQIYSTIVEQKTAIREAICINRQGQAIATMTADLCGTRLADVDLEIMRGNLCTIIKEASADLEYIFADNIVGLNVEQNGVNATFAHHPARTFDLVIGADGLHSIVRKLIFGPESNFSHEMGVYVAIFSIPNFLNLAAQEIEYHSLYKFVNVYKDRYDSNAKIAIAFSSPTITTRDIKEQKNIIANLFADSGWEMPKIMAAMQESTDFYFDVMAQIHMPQWSKQRISLVGDAAYSATPMSGQGTSIAITGAYVLAGELASAGGDYIQAFSNYEKLMRPFIRKNQALANLSSNIMQPGLYSKLIHKIASIIPNHVHLYFKKLALKRTTEAANAIVIRDYNAKNCEKSY